MSKISEGLLAAARVVAPTIASFIPGGPLAVGAFQALSNLVLGHANGSADDITSAIATMTPDQIAVVRKGDQEYQAKMAELGIEADKLDYDDRASARLMHSSTRDSTPAVLTYLLTLGFFGMLIMLSLHEVPAGNQAIVYGFTGSLGAAWGAAVSFWVGSTNQGARKTELLAQAQPVKT